MFEDSTHQLWHCRTVDGDMVLKICQQKNIAQSSFWQLTEQLFGLYLPRDLAGFASVQQCVEPASRIDLPELLACGGQTETLPAFILNRFVSGTRLSQALIGDAMIRQFAGHLAGLHSQQQEQWGLISQPDRRADSWPENLLRTVLSQCEVQRVGEPWLSLVSSQLESVNPTKFSPIMLDNRWDQYLVDGDNITALVDIDAFVIGPRELELILLEYQLDDRQAEMFADTYQQTLPIPDLVDVRLSYRLLLFLMNALGETDLDKWMRAPVRW